MQYEQIVRLQPQAVIMMNHGSGDGSTLKMEQSWPTDLMAIERWLPHSNRGFNPWFRISLPNPGAPEDLSEREPGSWCRSALEADYYIPGEVCDPIGYEWFHVDNDPPRSDGELLGMRLIAHERNVNLLLDVPPDQHGRIPEDRVGALMRLRESYERLAR